MTAPCAIGIDLGTSGVKAVLLAADGDCLAEAQAALTVSRPQSLWSEQAPADWLTATDTVVRALREMAAPADWARVRALAVAGQMHGAVLLDAQGQVLRPAILWNDGRSQAQCDALEATQPATRRITANRAMAGFTAPKLMWVAQHEPALFAQVGKVLLPKDWLVSQLAGVFSSDCSDAAGTLWLDVAGRCWSTTMLAATGMRPDQMPTLHEGPDAVGQLLPRWAEAWGLPAGVQLAAGAGDNAAGAVGMGVVAPGDGFLSLGTSGVIFVATEGPQANPERGVHTFCHALPGTWHQMAVMLAASSALSWWSGITGSPPADLLAGLAVGQVRSQAPLFLPYLSGERTPHADPGATGSFHGLVHGHSRDDLSYAVIEGVAFAFADGLDALREAGTQPQRLLAIGGGARSDVWLQMLADVLALPIDRPVGAEVGPALGAARLALLSLGLPPARVLAQTGHRPALCARPGRQRGPARPTGPLPRCLRALAGPVLTTPLSARCASPTPTSTRCWSVPRARCRTAACNCSPQPRSGRQQRLENIVNRFVRAGAGVRWAGGSVRQPRYCRPFGPAFCRSRGPCSASTDGSECGPGSRRAGACCHAPVVVRPALPGTPRPRPAGRAVGAAGPAADHRPRTGG